jgi:hypothetical protein
MTRRAPFALTSVLLVLFAAGHTYGFLSVRPSTAEGLAVLSSMQSVTFMLGHTPHTYWDFYLGFGLFISVYLLLAAIVAWELPAIGEVSPGAYLVLASALLAALVAQALLATVYFRGPPMVLSMALVASLAWGMIASARARAHVLRTSPSPE